MWQCAMETYFKEEERSAEKSGGPDLHSNDLTLTRASIVQVDLDYYSMKPL